MIGQQWEKNGKHSSYLFYMFLDVFFLAPIFFRASSEDPINFLKHLCGGTMERSSGFAWPKSILVIV